MSQIQRVIGKAERRRKECLEKEGLEVPPFLITSIATTCNLQCKGCYARKNGIAGDTPTKNTLSPDQWNAIFSEAAELGVSFCLLAGFPGDEKAFDGCLAAGRGFFHIGPDGSAEPCPFSPFSDRNVAQTGLRDALASPLFRKIRDARALGWKHTGGCTLYEHRDEVKKMLELTPMITQRTNTRQQH